MQISSTGNGYPELVSQSNRALQGTRLSYTKKVPVNYGNKINVIFVNLGRNYENIKIVYKVKNIDQALKIVIKANFRGYLTDKVNMQTTIFKRFDKAGYMLIIFCVHAHFLYIVLLLRVSLPVFIFFIYFLVSTEVTIDNSCSIHESTCKSRASHKMLPAYN